MLQPSVPSFVLVLIVNLKPNFTIEIHAMDGCTCVQKRPIKSISVVRDVDQGFDFNDMVKEPPNQGAFVGFVKNLLGARHSLKGYLVAVDTIDRNSNANDMARPPVMYIHGTKKTTLRSHWH